MLTSIARPRLRHRRDWPAEVAVRLTTRTIEAPASDTLSAAEVAVLLGYSDPKSVMRLVERGEFPEPIEDDGRKWLWEDVVWYQMTKRVRPRLRKPPPPPPADGSDDDTEVPPSKKGRA